MPKLLTIICHNWLKLNLLIVMNVRRLCISSFSVSYHPFRFTIQGATPESHPPFFSEKLVAIAHLIRSKLKDSDTSPSLLLCFQQRSQLLLYRVFHWRPLFSFRENKIQGTTYFPDSLGILFNHTFGKSIRGHSARSFAVKRCKNSVICPVSDFQLYLSTCKLLSKDVCQDCLFRATTKEGSVSANSFIGSSVYHRIKQYLTELGLDEGETPLSFQAGHSITLELLGVPKKDITSHLGWRTASMVDHYDGRTQLTFFSQS